MIANWKNLFGAILLVSAAGCAFAEDGVTNDTILIGQTIGVTGTVAAPVKEMIEGARAYIDSVNKSGGVNGRQIELRILDDQFDPQLAAQNAKKLIKGEHVFALFQSRGTPHTQAILPILETYQVPLVAPSTGAMVFRKPFNRLVFNVHPMYQFEVAKCVEQLNTLGTKDIGFLHVDDSFGQDALEGFTKAMAAHKLSPTVIVKFDRVKPDYAATAATIIKADPKALIIASSSQNTIEAIKAIRAKGGQMQLLTLSNNSSQSFVDQLGAIGVGVIITQITPAPDLISSGLGHEFKAAAQASNTTISYAAMDGFVSAKVLVEGLRRAGHNLTREKFIEAMETMRHLNLGGMVINYNEADHDGSEFVELTMIGKNGRIVR